VNFVVFFDLLAGRLLKLHGRKAQPLVFEPLQDAAHQQPVDAIGLTDDQCSFHIASQKQQLARLRGSAAAQYGREGPIVTQSG
jgi:hypothetical protein